MQKEDKEPDEIQQGLAILAMTCLMVALLLMAGVL